MQFQFEAVAVEDRFCDQQLDHPPSLVAGRLLPEVAVEKNEPFSTGVWELTEEVLDQAEEVNKAALARYRKCQLICLVSNP